MQNILYLKIEQNSSGVCCLCHLLFSGVEKHGNLSLDVGLPEDEFDIRPVFRFLTQHIFNQLSQLGVIPTGHLWQLMRIQEKETLLNIKKNVAWDTIYRLLGFETCCNNSVGKIIDWLSDEEVDSYPPFRTVRLLSVVIPTSVYLHKHLNTNLSRSQTSDLE